MLYPAIFVGRVALGGVRGFTCHKPRCLKEDWIKASKLVFEFKGLSIELGLLCALSQRKNLKILTKNKEVKKIKGVKLYEDEKG